MTRPALLWAACLWLGAGCTGGQTAILVEFDVQGAAASRARTLQILLRCVDDLTRGTGLPIERDISGLDPDEPPTLVIEPSSDDPCDFFLVAQLLGEGEDWPLASAREAMGFEPGKVMRARVVLNTGACFDADGDGAVAGIGGEHGCAGDRDCDDLDPDVHEGTEERCNGVDDDCNAKVDDVPEGALAAACPGWNARYGLCRYWPPSCHGGDVICPVLEQADDCALRLDTNCDGLTRCGCDPATVAVEQPCPPCQTARCEGDASLCVPNGPEGAWEREICAPATGACLGTWVCNGATNILECQTGIGLELCNGEGTGRDEDCDGLIDWDDPGCEALAAVPDQCGRFALARAGDGTPAEFPECPSHVAYSTAPCATSGFLDAFPEELVVLLDLPEGVILDVQRVSCCECTGYFVVDPDLASGLELVAIDVSRMRESQLLLVEGGGEVFITANAYNEVDPAIATNLEIAIPVVPPERNGPGTDLVRDLGACIANCSRVDLLELILDAGEPGSSGG